MPCKPVPRGATPLTLPETPLHRRPLIWMATVGALLLVMGLSLSGPETIDASIAECEKNVLTRKVDDLKRKLAEAAPEERKKPRGKGKERA